jgi:hypothetical protein
MDVPVKTPGTPGDRVTDDPRQPDTMDLVESEANQAIKSETGRSNHEALIREMFELRMDVNAIEEEIGRLEIALQKWESNHRWQLEDIRKELKTISWAANLCALGAIFYIVSESWQRWG